MSWEDFQQGKTGDLPPRVRFWKLLSQQQGDPSAELHMDSDGILTAPPRVSLIFPGSVDGAIRYEEAQWEPVFERWLLDELRLKYANEDGNHIRAYLLLQEAFEPIIADVGITYFHSVLLRRLQREPFDDDASLQELLQRAGRGNPSERLLPQTDGAIVGAIASVYQRLHHAHSEAEVRGLVLAGLRTYVDRAFHISTRRALGWS